MKKLLFILPLFGLMAGCSYLEKLYVPKVTQKPGEVISTNTVYVTNIVNIPAQVDASTGAVVAPARQEVEVKPIVTYTVAPPTLETNYVTNPSVESAVKFTELIPGWGGTVSFGLTTLLSLGAAWKNKRLAKGLVQSVQDGRDFLATHPEGQKAAEGFKETILKSQKLQGIQPMVKKLLDAAIPDHKTA